MSAEQPQEPQWCQPVFQHEDTTDGDGMIGDCQASHLECPACGIRNIVFDKRPDVIVRNFKVKEVVMHMMCLNGPPEFRHRFDLVLAYQDGEMLARCRVYPQGYQHPGPGVTR